MNDCGLSLIKTLMEVLGMFPRREPKATGNVEYYFPKMCNI